MFHSADFILVPFFELWSNVETFKEIHAEKTEHYDFDKSGNKISTETLINNSHYHDTNEYMAKTCLLETDQQIRYF